MAGHSLSVFILKVDIIVVRYPYLKQYDTRITIDNDAALKPELKEQSPMSLKTATEKLVSALCCNPRL